jgi:hypothetical protein
MNQAIIWAIRGCAVGVAAFISAWPLVLCSLYGQYPDGLEWIFIVATWCISGAVFPFVAAPRSSLARRGAVAMLLALGLVVWVLILRGCNLE